MKRVDKEQWRSTVALQNVAIKENIFSLVWNYYHWRWQNPLLLVWLSKPYCSRNMRMLEYETYPSLMVKICLNVSIFKDALIQKPCSIQWRIFTSEDSVKWYECCYYVSLLDSNLKQTTSNDWHNKLYHYDGTLSQLFPILSKMALLLTKRNTFSHQIFFRVNVRQLWWPLFTGKCKIIVNY